MTSLPLSLAVNASAWRVGLVAWAYVPVSIVLCVLYLVDADHYASELVALLAEGGYALAIQVRRLP